jgi:tetratricopeptide (TPR) repeat protein
VGGTSEADSAGELVALDLQEPTADLLELTTALSHDSLKSIASTEAELQALLRVEPGDFSLVRRLGEVLIEEGSRAEGLTELERAMAGFESTATISEALSVAEEILRLEPNSVKHHQKRVEYAYRSNDQALLIDAYLELADALFRTSQLTKASVVYDRVLELSPENPRANYAVAALLIGANQESQSRQGASGKPVSAPQAAAAVEEPADEQGDFINLADLVSEDEEPRTTRMVVEDEAPSGNEEADFAEMLEKFKRGLAENVDAEDYESHYDLGVAFREMGLLDEAIAQFQRALRGTQRRVRTLEALGQCFVERSQFQVACNVLMRALNEGGESDENLVGVLYLLGYASEALHNYPESLAYYQRVFMVDIQFRDVTTRIAAIEKMAS